MGPRPRRLAGMREGLKEPLSARVGDTVLHDCASPSLVTLLSTFVPPIYTTQVPTSQLLSLRGSARWTGGVEHTRARPCAWGRRPCQLSCVYGYSIAQWPYGPHQYPRNLADSCSITFNHHSQTMPTARRPQSGGRTGSTVVRTVGVAPSQDVAVTVGRSMSPFVTVTGLRRVLRNTHPYPAARALWRRRRHRRNRRAPHSSNVRNHGGSGISKLTSRRARCFWASGSSGIGVGGRCDEFCSGLYIRPGSL